MSSISTIFAAVTFNKTRTIRTFWGELSDAHQVFSSTDAVSPLDPNAVNHAILTICMPALSLVQRKPTRVVLESQEQADTFKEWAASLFPEHRLSWLLSVTPVEFAAPDKAERKPFAAVKQKADNALAEHIKRQEQAAEQAAAIEREAMRRLAQRESAQAQTEARLAAQHAAARAEQDAHIQALRDQAQADAEQRAFNAGVNARLAQIAGGAR
jgi:hypothetical protein